MSLGRAPTARSRYWCARLRVAFVVASSPRMTTTRGRQAERIRTYSMFSAVGCNENKWAAQMSSCAPEGATPGCRSISNSSRRWLRHTAQRGRPLLAEHELVRCRPERRRPVAIRGGGKKRVATECAGYDWPVHRYLYSETVDVWHVDMAAVHGHHHILWITAKPSAECIQWSAILQQASKLVEYAGDPL